MFIRFVCALRSSIEPSCRFGDSQAILRPSDFIMTLRRGAADVSQRHSNAPFVRGSTSTDMASHDGQHHHSQRKPLAKSRSEKRPTLNVQSARNSLSQWPTRAPRALTGGSDGTIEPV